MTTKGKNDSVSIRDVYELVDAAKTSFEKSIDKLSDTFGKSLEDLSTRFNTLESGRLSRVETKVANMEGKFMMIPMLITIAINAFFFIVEYILKPK